MYFKWTLESNCHLIHFDNSLYNKYSFENLLNYVESSFFQSDPKFFESIANFIRFNNDFDMLISDTKVNMREDEKYRFHLLKESFKRSLSKNEKPFGFKSVKDIKSSALILDSLKLQDDDITEFLKLFDNIVENANTLDGLNAIKKAKILYKKLQNDGYRLRDSILMQKHKMVWLMLTLDDEKRFNKTEIDTIIFEIEKINNDHELIIQKQKAYYANIDRLEVDYIKKVSLNKKRKSKKSDLEYEFEIQIDQLIKQNMKPLILDSMKIKNLLQDRLEYFPNCLSEKEKEVFSRFLIVLHAYYEDQNIAFSGGKSYMPLDNSLKSFKARLRKRTVSALLQQLKKMDNNLTHLYLLHGIAQSLMPSVNTFYRKFTLKNALFEIIEKRKQRNIYQEVEQFKVFYKAVTHIDDMVQKSIVWNSSLLEVLIKNYYDGIELIAKEFDIDLKSMKIPKKHHQISEDEINIKTDIYLQTNFSKTRDQVVFWDQEIAKRIFYDIRKNYWRNDKDSIAKLSKKLENIEKTYFAKKYFNLDYESVSDIVASYRIENVEKFKHLDVKSNMNKKVASGLLYWVFREFQENPYAIDDMFEKEIKEINSMIERAKDAAVV